MPEEMRASDALWFLHAGLEYLEKELGKRESIEYLRNCARVVGLFINVPAPFDADMKELVKKLRGLDLATADDPGYDELSPDGEPTPSSPKKPSGNSAPERVEAAKTLVDAMESSGLFEWADMVTDMHGKLHGDDPFVTDKQFRALLNIAKRGTYNDDSLFLDSFEDEYPEAYRFAEQCAGEA